jgi:hypothetical protein
MKIKLIISGLIIAAAALLAYFQFDLNKTEELPKPQTYNQTKPAQSPTPTPLPNSSSPAEINLAVPFTSQAPHKNWEEPYQNFCEEASVLMASHYILNRAIPTPEYADAEMLKIKDWEEKTLGYNKDTTAKETARILTEYFKIPDVELVYNPTISQIKQALASGKVMVVPAAGRQLPNPNFRSPGPLYHMLVIKGYTKDGKIITNDPGTRLGADFTYDPQALLDAIHDWNGGDVENGQKVIIIVG